MGDWNRYVGSSGLGEMNYWDYFGHRMSAMVEIPRHAHILDVGCGTGSSFVPAALKLGLNGRGVAVDIDREVLNNCMHRISQYDIHNALCVQMDAADLGLIADCFDIVLSGFIGWDYCFDFVLNRFTRPDIYMKEIHHVLRPGGLLLVSSWSLQDDLEWFAKTIRKYMQQLAPDFTKQHPINSLPYSKETTRGLEIIFKSAGFTDIRCYTEQADFSSPDENTWWEQMRRAGWAWYLADLKKFSLEKYKLFKEKVFEDLQSCKSSVGIIFSKSVIFTSGYKPQPIGSDI